MGNLIHRFLSKCFPRFVSEFGTRFELMVWDCYGHMDLSICFFVLAVIGLLWVQQVSRYVRGAPCVSQSTFPVLRAFETHSFYITYIYYLHHILHIYYLYHIYYIIYYIIYSLFFAMCFIFWDGFRSECSEPYPWSHDTSPSCFDLPQHVPMHCPPKKQHLNFPARIFQ